MLYLLTSVEMPKFEMIFRGIEALRKNARALPVTSIVVRTRRTNNVHNVHQADGVTLRHRRGGAFLG